MSKKKKEIIGVIKGIDTLKNSYDGRMASFRFETFRTEKDRPRKRYKAKDWREY